VSPPIGIEAKAIDVDPPEDSNDPEMKKGLKQSKDREASYFIWTNGDSRQFFSLALPTEIWLQFLARREGMVRRY